MSNNKDHNNQNSKFQRSLKSFSRRQNLREVRESILIITEGKKTEPTYFLGLRAMLKLLNVKIEILPGAAMDKTIVERAIQLKGNYDEVWAVFDRETPVTNKNYFEAIELALHNNIKLAVSDPCFEYWLLLHFKSTDGSFANCDNVIRELRRTFPDYEKNTALPDEFLKKAKAIADLAKDLHQRQLSASMQPDKEKFNCPPSTTVYELVYKLYSFK